MAQWLAFVVCSNSAPVHAGLTRSKALHPAGDTASMVELRFWLRAQPTGQPDDAREPTLVLVQAKAGGTGRYSSPKELMDAYEKIRDAVERYVCIVFQFISVQHQKL